MRQLASEFPFDAVGSAVLQALLPPRAGPTATVPVTMGDQGLEPVDGVEAKAVVVDQLAGALAVIEDHARVLPRKVMHPQQILAGFPLVSTPRDVS